jgi:hypothetical protein
MGFRRCQELTGGWGSRLRSGARFTPSVVSGQGQGQGRGSGSESGFVPGQISLSLSSDSDGGSMDSSGNFSQPCWFFGEGFGKAPWERIRYE